MSKGTDLIKALLQVVDSATFPNMGREGAARLTHLVDATVRYLKEQEEEAKALPAEEKTDAVQ